MTVSRIISGAAIIAVVILSDYFGAVAAARIPSAVGPSLTIYQHDSRGQIVASTSNVFEAGQLIWVAIPSGVSPPYSLNLRSLSGRTVFSQQNSTIPAIGLIPISLAPTVFAPSSSFTIALQDMVPYSPGFSSPQTSTTSFSVVPALGSVLLGSSTVQNNRIQTRFGLQDMNGSPLTGVRVGLFLVEGNNSLQVTTEKTDLKGEFSFNVGESLASGSYRLEARVLDNSAIFSTPTQLPTLDINSTPTTLTAWNSTIGPQALLTEQGSSLAVGGRLVVLQQELSDGNWNIVGTSYTDNSGHASFAPVSTGTYRVSFNGDSFYAASRSSVLASGPSSVSQQTTDSPSASGVYTPIGVGQLSSVQSGSCTVQCPCGPTQAPISQATSVVMAQTVIPNCGGGGGGGGGSTPTTTTLSTPSSTYATIPTVLTARVVYGSTNPVVGGSVFFYNSTSATNVLGVGTTNSTGCASLIWAPNSVGSKTLLATYNGSSTYYGSSGQASLTINKNPTTIELLEPQQIAYSWDLYNYYSGKGLPIVLPVNILSLALWNNTSPAAIYMPPYTGISSTPSHVSGYGWTGINQSSVVIIAINGTYPQTQSMNWTQNFYLPLCPTQSGCSAVPRTGHMYLTGTLSPPNTLYSSSSTSLSVPYQNIKSVDKNPSQSALAMDASTETLCLSPRKSCSGFLTTSHQNDIIIVFASQIHSTGSTACSFSVTDSNGLSWINRTNIIGSQYYRGIYLNEYQEFYAKSPTLLTSDNITESISSCGSYSNGLQVLAINGANYTNPFDSTPGTGTGYGFNNYSTMSTTNPYDMIIAGVSDGPKGVSTTPTPQSGFNVANSTWGAATEYMITDKALTNSSVTFWGSSYWWEEIADALRGVPLYQESSPPSQVYVNVSTTYPSILEKMQGLPVALSMYLADLGYPLQQNPSSSVQCNPTCINVYTLPILNSTNGADLAYACLNISCTRPASNFQLSLYNSKGQYCLTTAADYDGVAELNVVGPQGCTYPYSYLETNTTQVSVGGLYAVESVSNANLLYTNFQGYSYATHSPLRTGPYLLHLRTLYPNSSYTVLYPSMNYPDVQQPSLSCCDVFFTVQKHPVQGQASFVPGTATILDMTNATIHLTDLASKRPMSNLPFSYVLTRTNPGPTTQFSGTTISDSNGTIALHLGTLPYGNYSLGIAWPGNSTVNQVQSSFTFTVYLAIPTVILSVAPVLTSPVMDMTPPGLFLPTPGGSSGTPSVFQAGNNYTVQTYIGEDTALSSNTNCLSTSPFNPSPAPTGCFRLWIGYGSTAPTAVTQATSGCTPFILGLPSSPVGAGTGPCNGIAQSISTLSEKSTPSIYCNGALYCYLVSLVLRNMEASAEGNYVALLFQIWDTSGNYATTTTYAYIEPQAGPNGIFAINGQSMTTASAIKSSSSIVTFQFAGGGAFFEFASLGIGNETGPGAGSITWLQNNWLANPTVNLYFDGGGTYNITGTINCGCTGPTQFIVLFLQLTVGQTPWIENAVVGQAYSFTSSLANNATGTLIAVSGLAENVYVNNNLYGTYVTNSGGNLTFAWTPSAEGQYWITVKLPSQNYYANSSITSMISAKLRNVQLTVNRSPPNPLAGQSVSWAVLARDMITEASLGGLTVNMYINGSQQPTRTTNSTGYAVFTYNFTLKGFYNATFVSATTSVYNSATSYSPLIVFLNTAVTIQAGTIIVDQQNSISVTLKDQNGSPLASRIVQISISGVSFANVTTGGNGQASFNWSPTSTGNYTIVVSYSASGSLDIGYQPSSSSTVVTVKPRTIINTQTIGSGMQSVTFQTAQGNPQSSASSPSVSIGFPSIASVSMTIRWGSLNISGTVGESNQFGISCVAEVFGTCVMVAPFWKPHINLNVPNYGWLTLAFNALSLDAPSVIYSIPCLDLINTASPAFRDGISAGFAMDVPILAVLFASIFAPPGVAEGAALIFDMAMLFGVPLVLGLLPSLYSNKADRFSFAAGFLLTMLPGVGILAGVLGAGTNVVQRLVQSGIMGDPLADVKILVLTGEIFGVLMSLLFTLSYCYGN